MRYEYFPEPDPDTAPISPELRARVLADIEALDRREKRGRLRMIGATGLLLIVAWWAYLRIHPLFQSPPGREMVINKVPHGPLPRMKHVVPRWKSQSPYELLPAKKQLGPVRG